MWLKRVAPPKLVCEFIERCKKIGYFDADVSGNHLKNIKFLSMGESLRDKIAHEWYNIDKHFEGNIQMHTKVDVQLDLVPKSSISFVEKYKEIIKDMDIDNLKMFGIVETHVCKRDMLHGNPTDEKSLTAEISKGGKEMVSFFVVGEDQELEYFSTVQRNRKFWWMQYAANPGRFSLSPVHHEKIRNLKVETVWLSANYQFGHIPLEKIQLMPGNCFQTAKINVKNEPILKNKIIKTSTLLDVAALGKFSLYTILNFCGFNGFYFRI